MGVHKNQGFTIIEVTLVLAVSSLLLAFMATGITLAVQRQRFSDSVNGTQSFLQQQFSLTQNIVNNRLATSCDPASPGSPIAVDPSDRGASGCLVIGKLLEIVGPTGSNQESTIFSYDVVATNVDTEIPPYKDYSDIELIRAIKPTVIKQGTADISYIVPWGAELTTIKDADGTGGNSTPVHFITILRSPRSGVVHVYKVTNPPAFANTGLTVQVLSTGPLDVNIQDVVNPSVKMCVKSVDLASFGSLLEIRPSGSQDGIITHFDDAAKAAYPCS